MNKTSRKESKTCGVFIKTEPTRVLVQLGALVEIMRVWNKIETWTSLTPLGQWTKSLMDLWLRIDLITHSWDGIRALLIIQHSWVILMIIPCKKLILLKDWRNSNQVTRRLLELQKLFLKKIMMRNLSSTMFKVSLSTQIHQTQTILPLITVLMKKISGLLVKLYSIKAELITHGLQLPGIIQSSLMHHGGVRKWLNQHSSREIR